MVEQVVELTSQLHRQLAPVPPWAVAFASLPVPARLIPYFVTKAKRSARLCWSVSFQLLCGGLVFRMEKYGLGLGQTATDSVPIEHLPGIKLSHTQLLPSF